MTQDGVATTAHRTTPHAVATTARSTTPLSTTARSTTPLSTTATPHHGRRYGRATVLVDGLKSGLNIGPQTR
ncbi:MAG: hypothetical protein GY835_19380 [bacterium]|nr:hypothetical protein [bacterium]